MSGVVFDRDALYQALLKQIIVAQMVGDVMASLQVPQTFATYEEMESIREELMENEGLVLSPTVVRDDGTFEVLANLSY